MRSVLTIMRKELREILRDPYTLAIALVMPLVLLLLFSYSLNLDVKDIPLAVLDYDKSHESRRYITAFVNTGKFDLRFYPENPSAVTALLDEGRAQVAVVIPAGFSRTLVGGGTAAVQTLVDGTFPTSARVVQGYVNTINEVFTAELLADHFEYLGLKSGGLLQPAVLPATRVRYNPSLKSLNLIVPGLIGVLLMSFPTLLSALAIVREKEYGSVQQIFISPTRPVAFIIGKLLPYVAIAYLELLLILATARFWFQTPLAGNLGLLLVASVPYVIGTVAIGLLVSTVTHNQLTAMLLAIVLTFMPSFLFSGFMFPIYTMPVLMQMYSYLFPARYFIEITYDVFLKGVGLDVWLDQLVILILYTAVLVGLAAIRFKKKVD